MFQIAMEKLEIPQEIPVGLAFKLGMSVLAHPLEVSKVLIQVVIIFICYTCL